MTTVLLCIEDDNTRADVADTAHDLGIGTVPCATVQDAMQYTAQADMMLVDWNTDDYAPDPLLDLWKRTRGGPVAILYAEMPNDVHVRLLSERTTWNVLPYPDDPLTLKAALLTMLIRYVGHVQVSEKLTNLERKVNILHRWVIGMAIALSLILLLTLVVSFSPHI